MRRLLPTAVTLALAVAAACRPVAAQPVRYDTDYPSAEFHAGRREALLSLLPDTSIAVVFSAPVATRDNDMTHDYRQSSDLYYLTGSTEAATILLLAPHGVRIGGETVREVLFVPESTRFSETWLGRRFGTQGAEEVLGIARAVPASNFESILNQVASPAVPLLVLAPAGGVESGSELAGQLAAIAPHLRNDPDAEVRSLRLRSFLDEMRRIKHPEELRLMQQAIDATTEALRTAMRAAEPGMYEYELEAVIEYVFHRSGAESPAFASIVGSGENTTILHYETNRRRTEAGDLVLMDVGAEFRNYAADVTRTIPIDGTFSEEQRAIYELVLAAQTAAIDAVRSGNSFFEPHRTAQEVIGKGLIDLGIMEEGGDVMDYLLHGTSHFLGLSVHDVGSHTLPLEPGVVLTVEPGIYLRPSDDLDSRWWNIGVRIEDDVLVTDGDPVVLSKAAPRTVADIEALMLEDCGLTVGDCG